MRGVWLGLCLLLIPVLSAAATYKWRDAQGHWHYGDAPPARGAQALEATPPPTPADRRAAERHARDWQRYNQEKDREWARAAAEQRRQLRTWRGRIPAGAVRRRP